MTYSDYSREKALERYRDWKRGLSIAIRGFFEKRVISTVEDKKWHDAVMNFFDYPYTNAVVGRKNALAKRLKQKGVGYDNETIEVKMRSSDSFRRGIPTRKT